MRAMDSLRTMPVPSTEELVTECLGQLGAGQVALALAGMTAAYEAAAGAAQWSAAAWTANWIGHVHENHLGDLETALAWFATAQRAARSSATDLPRTVATARFNAGLVEARRGRTTASLGHFDHARAAAADSDDRILEATCAERLGVAMAELGGWPEGLAELRWAGTMAERGGDVDLASSCAAQAAAITSVMALPPGAQFARLARAGLDRCLATVQFAEPSRVLDAGCGSGAELLAIAERWPGARVVGVDLPETVRSIRIARQLRRRVEVRAGDLTVPADGLDGFDVAVCHAVLHGVEQPATFLGGLARAVRPGGELVGALFTDDYHRQLRQRLSAAGIPLPRPDIVHRQDEITAALVGAGFTGIETWTESVVLEVPDTRAAAHLERLLGRTLETGEADRLLDAVGRPLRLDLSPLSFHAVAGRVDPEKTDIRVDQRPREQ
jgi:arsenite methyltransferase